MKFKLWIENQIIEMQMQDLLVSRKGLVQAFNDYKDGKESRTHGPVHVWQTDNNKYQLIDGYHRFVFALISGQKTIKAEIIGKGYSDYWVITKPEDAFEYNPSITYRDLQNLADKELYNQLKNSGFYEKD